MFRTVMTVGAPLFLGLSLGGLASLGAVHCFDALGMNLSDRQEAVPVVGLIVLFGFRGAVESANRLAALLRPGGALDPGSRR